MIWLQTDINNNNNDADVNDNDSGQVYYLRTDFCVNYLLRSL